MTGEPASRSGQVARAADRRAAAPVRGAELLRDRGGRHTGGHLPGGAGSRPHAGSASVPGDAADGLVPRTPGPDQRPVPARRRGHRADTARRPGCGSVRAGVGDAGHGIRRGHDRQVLLAYGTGIPPVRTGSRTGPAAHCCAPRPGPPPPTRTRRGGSSATGKSSVPSRTTSCGAGWPWPSSTPSGAGSGRGPGQVPRSRRRKAKTARASRSTVVSRRAARYPACSWPCSASPEAYQVKGESQRQGWSDGTIRASVVSR